MLTNDSINDTTQEDNYPSSYREVKIGRTYYYVTSVFTGEIELGPTLEKLAVQKVLREMDARAKDILRTS